MSAPVNAVAQRQEEAPDKGERGSVRTRWSTQLAERKCTPRPTARRAMRGGARWRARLRGSEGGNPCLLTRARAPRYEGAGPRRKGWLLWEAERVGQTPSRGMRWRAKREGGGRAPPWRRA